MAEEILKALPVAFSSMFKFILGPVGGYAVGLHIITTIIATVVGTMVSVVGFTYFGDWLRDRIVNRYFSKQKKFSAGNRKFVVLWRRYGILGVAVLMPIIFTPIGGTLLAVGFGSPKERILVYMFISSAVWATLFSVAIYSFGNAVLPEFVKSE
jgi:hypothetical protein